MSIEDHGRTSRERLFNRDYINNPENRELIERKFTEAIESILVDFAQQTGDSDFIFENVTVPYQLDPPVVLAMATITSKKLQYFTVTWDPAEKEFTRTMIMIKEEYRKQGLGSVMNSVTEEIAKNLGCNSVTVQAIAETSIDYWRKKPDYKMDERDFSATKII